ncbi:phage tail assembly protein [Martelella mediterranea]|uniref:Tail assembly chaperone E/41/14-like protein n=1 Tax=Martelella mediterranea TaxID=293089 RepID=A0A4R3NTM3_9HYPH|nr:phage tail assembly protein [Martelella mediterranea]TCT41140.1 tail assembly chaperone E/41/14-like protein [Martelella mediterranea]
MTPLKSKVTIPLSVPVEFTTEDDKPATRDSITIKRPKLRHAKRLAVLVGPELVKALMANGETEIDKAKLATEISGAMMKADVLDEATAVLADMCGETADFIDGLDWNDLPKLFEAFVDFFPALLSAAPSK